MRTGQTFLTELLSKHAYTPDVSKGPISATRAHRRSCSAPAHALITRTTHHAVSYFVHSQQRSEQKRAHVRIVKLCEHSHKRASAQRRQARTGSSRNCPSTLRTCAMTCQPNKCVRTHVKPSRARTLLLCSLSYSSARTYACTGGSGARTLRTCKSPFLEHVPN
jgi:hypothetical protein